MRLRWGAWVGAAIAPLGMLYGCGGTVTGAAADGGGVQDGTTDVQVPSAGSEGGEAEASDRFTASDASLGVTSKGCADGGHTSLSGTVYDPAGENPLFSAVVYIPSDPQSALPALDPGTGSCSDFCEPMPASSYIAAAQTDTNGAFTLDDVPAGKKVPLVIQLGKWRREVAVDTVNCANTIAPASLTRLPRNQSEGDIPQMALLTGGCDELACLLRDIGLDATEFSGPAGGGRLHVYRGAGPGPDLAGGGAGPAGDCTVAGCPLWTTKAALEKYDVVLLGCECGEHNETKPDMGPMHDWLGEGGRLLATHDQDTWFKNGPADFQGVADWAASETDGPTPGPFQVDTSYLKGTQLRAWLQRLGATNANGSLQLTAADVSTSVTGVNAATQRWIYDSASSGLEPKALSFDTPVGGVPPVDGRGEPDEIYCGRATFTDIHAGGGGVQSSAAVPASCAGGAASAEEKALEFLFFDLMSNPCYVPTPVHPGF